MLMENVATAIVVSELHACNNFFSEEVLLVELHIRQTLALSLSCYEVTQEN